MMDARGMNYPARAIAWIISSDKVVESTHLSIVSGGVRLSLSPENTFSYLIIFLPYPRCQAKPKQGIVMTDIPPAFLRVNRRGEILIG